MKLSEEQQVELLRYVGFGDGFLEDKKLIFFDASTLIYKGENGKKFVVSFKPVYVYGDGKTGQGVPFERTRRITGYLVGKLD